MSKRILIIEDEADMRELYAEYLRTNGFDVTVAGDGQAGLDLAKKGDWDLLFLDIMLPKVDGLEVLKAVKSDPNLANRFVVLLTNLDKNSILERGLELGADGYLVKSVISPQELLDTASSKLSHARDKNSL